MDPTTTAQVSSEDDVLDAFARRCPPTIGVEEEYVVQDPATGEPCWDAPDLLAELDDPRFKGELAACQIEHATEPCVDLAAVHERIRAGRRHLVSAAPDRAFSASGTHPTATMVATLGDDPRYRETLVAHGWAARQQLVSALQVHVAVRPARVAVAVHDALRSYLPELIGLSASAPFHGGVDTGLATARPLIGGMLPRQGVPPAFGSVAAYRSLRTWMAAAGVGEERRLWWEVRLRPAYGTVEIRAMDSQPTAAAAVSITALVASLTVWLAERVAAGEALPVHPRIRIEESRWRALQGGCRAALLDLDTGEEEPLARRVGRLLVAVAPTAARLGGEDLLGGVEDLLRDDPVAQQRAVVERRGADGLARWLADRFAT